MRHFRSIPALLALGAMSYASLGAQEKVSFADDVRPILERSCLTCGTVAEVDWTKCPICWSTLSPIV